ncbi:MAG: PAS domain-containing sensor histidine kinase [Alphaproteobacteria bacterium]|nr:MAG: PAS domain-containing sensor histidine kinase [Alphaproteobacteria bacterium]
MSIRNKIDLKPQISALALPQAENARCAINEDGTIIYANDAFYQLCNINEAQRNYALDIFTFSEDVLDDIHDISTLIKGEHDVHINDNPIITGFHFDWLTTSDDKRYLIASATDDALESDLNHDLDLLITKIQSSAARIETAFDNVIDIKPTADDSTEFVMMTHDIMIITDEQGRIINANNVFLENFGYTSAELRGASFLNLFSDEDRPTIRNTMLSLTYNADKIDDPDSISQIIDFETRILTRGKQPRWVEFRQKCVGGKIYSLGRDITNLKQQQSSLKRRQKQLSEAEAIGRMGHWHWLIGEDNISWSEEIFRIFGVDQNQYKPCINGLTDLIHKRDLGRVVQVFQRAIIEEKNYDMEFRIVRPGGDIRFIMCEGRCEKDETGEIIALYGIMQDMTERMLYEQELRQARDASEQAYAAKSRFLANMSHELRTPLNAVIGFSEMIESQMLGPIFNEKYIEYATSIKDSGKHLLDLISDILDMSKIEAGKHTLELEEINIKDIIARAIHMINGRAQEQDIQLRTPDIEDSDINIIGDRRALTQILLNLLSNAVKFTPAHGSVWIECQKKDTYISLKVCDTGVGIPPNKLASVLRPFEQASSQYTRDHEGTGLGLSITKKLIELHNGSLHIESTVDIGTTVTVRLPYDAGKTD